MKHAFRSVAALIFCWMTVFCLPQQVYAADVTQTAEEILLARVQADNGDSVQQWIEETLCAAAGSGSADWYIMALSHSTENYDLTTYGKALREVLHQNSSNAVTRQRNALAYLAVSPQSVNAFRSLADETLGQQGIMSLVYGLHLQNNGVPASVSAEDTVSRLLSMQLADGGWAVSGSQSDVDVTAMTLQALAVHKEEPAVAAAIEKALEHLSAVQLEDGGYQSYGTANPESAAQVWMALSLLGIDGLTDARFIKYCTLYDAVMAFSCGEGLFSHTAEGPANAMATVQVYLALTAYDRLLKGQDSFYHFADAIPLPEESTVSQITTVTTTTTTATTAASQSAAASAVQTGSATAAETEETTTSAIVTTTKPRVPFVWQPDAYLLKWVLTAAVLVGAAIGVLVLMKRGRRHILCYIAVALVAALLIAAVHCLRIESPDDYYQGGNSVTDAAGEVTVSISCELLPEEHHHTALPEDGQILGETKAAFAQGDTVLQVLRQLCREHHIQHEIDGTDALAYVKGIADLYEFDYGELSGWVYLVNGERPSVGCGQYTLSDGDVIRWVYTLEQGNDIP